jgi:hypothetical protein
VGCSLSEGFLSVAWKIVERLCLLLGTVFTVVIAYYTLATYYGWNNPQAGPAPSAALTKVVQLSWWLGVGIGIGLLLTGWTMMFQRRRTSRIVFIPESMPPPDNREWLSGYDVWKLADPEILQASENAMAAVKDGQHDLGQRENDLRDLYKQKPPPIGIATDSGFENAIEILKQAASDLRDRLVKAEMRKMTADALLVENLHDKLARGELMAKGFNHPLGIDRVYKKIPAHEWNVLRFKVGYKEAEGQGIKYVGITVARA